jgi:hypothetical protein
MLARDPKQQLGDAIRAWIHMDNLTESFTHQATNARQLRNKHETEAIRLVKQLGLQESTIKVSGAALHLAKRKVTGGLTWSYLDKEIAAWSTKNGITATQSASLIAWLHAKRDVSETEYIKKDAKLDVPLA